MKNKAKSMTGFTGKVRESKSRIHSWTLKGDLFGMQPASICIVITKTKSIKDSRSLNMHKSLR